MALQDALLERAAPPTLSEQLPRPPIGGAAEVWILDAAKMPDDYVVASDVQIAPPVGSLGVYLNKLQGLECVFMKVSAYPKIFDLIERLYRKYLIDKYDPRTYGDAWILVEDETGRLVVDWRYLTTTSHRYERFIRQWTAAAPLSDCGIIAGSGWRIAAGDCSAFGVVTKSLSFFTSITRSKSRAKRRICCAASPRSS